MYGDTVTGFHKVLADRLIQYKSWGSVMLRLDPIKFQNLPAHLMKLKIYKNEQITVWSQWGFSVTRFDYTGA